MSLYQRIPPFLFYPNQSDIFLIQITKNIIILSKSSFFPLPLLVYEGINMIVVEAMKWFVPP